jgi:hypothetical protein
MLAAEAAPKQAGSRTMMVGVVALVAIVGIVGVGVAMRPAPHPAVTATATPPPTAAAGEAPKTAATEAPTPTPTAVPSVTPEAPPADIELTIDADPKTVDVFQGPTKLGSSASPIKIKRADGKVKLTFKAAGYAPQDIEVPASANTVVAVKLKKVVGQKKSGDLEF